MIIEQETRTVIKAEEGKTLVRKSDGRVAGQVVHLGYNYYEAGMLLENPKLATPDDYEEADAPAEGEAPKPNDFARMKQMCSIIEKERKAFDGRNLTVEEMLLVKELAPRLGYEIKVGDAVKQGQKFSHNDKLYEVLQDHTILPHYEPSENTVNLYKEVK
jgi:hypothetical protein